jgi:hypothetical protein
MKLGLVAPPQLPESLVENAAEALQERLRNAWEVSVLREKDAPDATRGDGSPTIGPEESGMDEAFARLRRRREQEGWDLLVALTDLPLRDGPRVIVADANDEGDVVILSLPAVGGARRKPRLVSALAEIAEDAANDGTADLRIKGPVLRGHTRVVAGMVRANRPWRIVGKLVYMLSAAFATSAFALVTADIWTLSDALSPVNLIVLTALSVITMVGWLIFVHDLWEAPRRRGGVEQATLFNVVTALSLGLGVACLSVVLFLATLVGELVIIRSSVLEQSLKHGVGLHTYVVLAWMVSAMATVGGAIGSGLEQEIDIRAAAYSYHPEREDGEGNREQPIRTAS